jgi:F-type H+-transporting ATPase subunit delta
MARRAYARRYSQAVFKIALETNELDRWQSYLNRVAGLAADASLVSLLQSTVIHYDVKFRLLSEQLSDVSPLMLNLVYLLIARGQLGLLGDITDEYERLLNSHRGIEWAGVTTAVPLDDGERQRLAEQLTAIIGKRVILKEEVDPGLLGGITVRVGGKLMDGSTRSKLMALKRELAHRGK